MTKLLNPKVVGKNNRPFLFFLRDVSLVRT